MALSFLTLRANCAFNPGFDADFDTFFTDSTLRLDYIFSGMNDAAEVSLRRQSKTPRWDGRRINLDSLHLAANGRITLTTLTGDTVYRHSFSSLFLEWIETGDTTARAFEHVVLVPAPRDPVRITLELTDNRRSPIARHSFVHNPGDILIRRPQPVKADITRLASGSFDGIRIPVTILSEGYRASERDSFLCHARTTVDQIFSHEPFSEMQDRFDFYAVFIPSTDSGVSVPRLGEWRNTAFKSHFSTFYSDRYLTCQDLFSLHDQITGLPAQHIIVLANTDEYGGGGIFNSYTLTTARHRDFKPVVVHEFGHSFGGLADEYFYDNDVMTDTYPTDIEPWEKNITTLTDFHGKWEELVPEKQTADSEVGLFEGGGYSAHGIWRPADNCRMRINDINHFCPGCILALRRLIHFYTGD